MTLRVCSVDIPLEMAVWQKPIHDKTRYAPILEFPALLTSFFIRADFIHNSRILFNHK
jgi:hypothetical protein